MAYGITADHGNFNYGNFSVVASGSADSTIAIPKNQYFTEYTAMTYKVDKKDFTKPERHPSIQETEAGFVITPPIDVPSNISGVVTDTTGILKLTTSPAFIDFMKRTIRQLEDVKELSIIKYLIGAASANPSSYMNIAMGLNARNVGRNMLACTMSPLLASVDGDISFFYENGTWKGMYLVDSDNVYRMPIGNKGKITNSFFRGLPQVKKDVEYFKYFTGNNDWMVVPLDGYTDNCGTQGAIIMPFVELKCPVPGDYEGQLMIKYLSELGIKVTFMFNNIHDVTTVNPNTFYINCVHQGYGTYFSDADSVVRRIDSDVAPFPYIYIEPVVGGFATGRQIGNYGGLEYLQSSVGAFPTTTYDDGLILSAGVIDIIRGYCVSVASYYSDLFDTMQIKKVKMDGVSTDVNIPDDEITEDERHSFEQASYPFKLLTSSFCYDSASGTFTLENLRRYIEVVNDIACVYQTENIWQ